MFKYTLSNALNASFAKNAHITAIVHNGQYKTYKTLSEDINRMARYILSLGFVNSPIAFCLTRGFDVIITMLAILKSGNFYVPLDTAYPVERIKFILNDVKPEFIITNVDDDLLLTIFGEQSKIIDLNDKQIIKSIAQMHHPISLIKYAELAYVIYTSGTTGQPKGVMIKQKSLYNLCTGANSILQTDPMNVLHFISPGFDAAGWDIYPSLLTGSTIYIASDTIATNPSKLYKFIKQNEINMVTLTPAILTQMPTTKIDSLKILVVMGDKPDPKYMNIWTKYCDVYNGYGPTETTIGATIHKYSENDIPNNIGKPFANYNIYLLNENLEQVLEGELYIGGSGVAKGYWNNTELTNKKFINYNNEKVYRTGDLAKFDANNDIIFIGRIDNQIKINSVRIELEEIESLVKKLEFVKETCVTYDGKQLTVYYTCYERNTNLNEFIKTYLSLYLHRAVLPHRYQQIDEFILNTNGKIDKKKLPDYNKGCLKTDTLTENERILVDICKYIFETEHVGINTNIFEIGANSLNIARIAKALKKYKLHVNTLDIFKYPILSNLVEHVTQLNKIDKIYVNKKIYNLTPQQLSLWFFQQMYPNDTSYNTNLIYKFTGDLNEEILMLSLQKIIMKHSALMTKINIVDGIPMQNFNDLILIQTKNLSIDNILISIENDVNTKFNMINEHLCKIKLYRNTDCWVLSIIAHNIIIDAYSINIIKSDLEKMYNQNKLGSNLCKVSYGNYIEHNLSSSTNENISVYWKKQLKDSVSFTLPKNINSVSGVVTRQINLPTLDEFIKESGTTKYIVLLTAFNILLRHYSGNSDIIIGTQIADRYDPNWINTIGFMVSTLILRNKINMDITICDLIKQINETLHDAISNRYISYDRLVTLCDAKIDVMFVMQNTGATNKIKLNDVNVEMINIETNSAFPLYIDVFDDDNNQTIRIKHSSDFNSVTITQMLDSYEIILIDMIENYNSKVFQIKYLDTIPIVTGIDINWIKLTIDSAIIEQAELCKELTAIMYSTSDNDHLDRSMTYFELNEESNKIAHCLVQQYNIMPGNIIGVQMNRGKNLILILIAILKAGACYLPIDSNYPIDRRAYMIDSSKPKLIISNTYELCDTRYVTIITILENADIIDCVTNINLATPTSLAYIIYTSGSTGLPKAVMITHKSVMNILNYFRTEWKITAQDKIWNLTSPSFDIMVLEIFLPLISGCKLLICPQCISNNPVLLAKWINNEKPTILQATPTQYSLIINHIEPNDNLTILVGGEAITNKMINLLLYISENVYNVYGPTETTIWSTCKKIKRNDNINIGKPICNTKCVILNEMQQSVPNGCVGELCISGMGLSIGYLNDEAKTAEKFIKFNNETFYKTGDLVRFNEFSELEYIGRTDFQVKIRGHRVELGEIISIMETHESIKRALVIAVTHDTKKFLVAYYIGINDESIIEYIRSKLPSFMIPNFVIWLPRFPETLNGKVDLKQLPSPFDDTSNIVYVRSGNHVKPRNDMEQKVHDMFAEIMSCSDMSVTESILNLGATSIMFPQFIAQIKNEFGKDILMETFILNSTIAMCAKLLIG